MIPSSLLATLVSLVCRHRWGLWLWEHVLIEAGRILVIGDDCRISLASRAFGIPEVGAAVHVEFLKRLVGSAGRRGSIALLGSEMPGGRFRAMVGRTTYRSSDPTDNREALAAEDIPVPPDAETWQLEPADFTKGGAVAMAAEAASSDRTRPKLNGVHIDALASGTDGHILTRRPMLSKTQGLGLFLPLSVIRALLRLVQATAPSDVRLHRKGEDVWVVGFFNDSTWTLRARRPDVDAVHYEQVTEAFAPNVRFAVDAADLRELWKPFRHDRSPFFVSFFRDGSLLVWVNAVFGACPDCLAEGRCPLCAKPVPAHYAIHCPACGWRLTESYSVEEHPSACKGCRGTGAGAGIAPVSLDFRDFATTLRAMPDEGPVVTLSSLTVPTLVERLPTEGAITVEVEVVPTRIVDGNGQEPKASVVSIGGMLASPIKPLDNPLADRGLPRWLWHDLAKSFEAVPHRDIVLPPKPATVRKTKPIEPVEAAPRSSGVRPKVAARKPARDSVQAEPSPRPAWVAETKPAAMADPGAPPCKPGRARKLLELVQDAQPHGILGPHGLKRRPREQERNAFDSVSLFALFCKVPPRAMRWFLRALGQPVPKKSRLLNACVEAQMQRWWPTMDLVTTEARVSVAA